MAKTSIKAMPRVSTMKGRQPVLRVFQLLRDEDISGVSGVGRVAVGVVFPSGKVVLEWLGENRSFEIFDTIEYVDRIHGHGGKTRVVFKSSTARV
jgi:hypothetical protein